jgi:predicted SAM-dependent methyltransferase
LYLNEQTDFLQYQKSAFCSRTSFYKLFRKQKNLDYTTDLFSPLADVKADICNLPLDDNQYDVILCNHVLEHIPDDTKAAGIVPRIETWRKFYKFHKI